MTRDFEELVQKQTSAEILHDYIVTISAEQWDDFEAWAGSPAKESDTLRCLAAARPAWRD